MKESTPNVQVTTGEFATSDPTLLHQPTNDEEEALRGEVFAERKVEIRRDAKSAHDVPSQSSSMEDLHVPRHLNRDAELIAPYLEKITKYAKSRPSSKRCRHN